LPSADHAFILYKLAKLALSTPEIEERYGSIPDNHKLLEELYRDEGAREFCSALDEFLAEYGHQAVCEAEFRNPCWREDPGQVIGLVRNYLQSDITPPEEVRARQDRISIKAAKQADKLSLPKMLLIKSFLKASRKNIELRERLKDLIVLRSDRARRIYAEIRDRLIDRGLLSAPDDIYFLLGEEVERLLNQKLSPVKVDDIIFRRRRDFEWSRKAHVPKIQDGVAKIIAVDDFEAERKLKGVGVSPGKVEGRARVILDPRVDSHIEQGEILVAPVTDAGWTPLFINAAGLVVDVGGLLSHGSVVAREYGLPAVVGVTGATRQIKTGDRIFLDGGAGVVVKLD